jgi:hypothetical protein
MKTFPQTAQIAFWQDGALACFVSFFFGGFLSLAMGIG